MLGCRRGQGILNGGLNKKWQGNICRHNLLEFSQNLNHARIMIRPKSLLLEEMFHVFSSHRSLHCSFPLSCTHSWKSQIKRVFTFDFRHYLWLFRPILTFQIHHDRYDLSVWFIQTWLGWWEELRQMNSIKATSLSVWIKVKH